MPDTSAEKMKLLKEAFYDTERLYCNKYGKETDKSVENTKFYAENENISWITETENNETAKVVVNAHDSIWEASDCVDNKLRTTVLNFASAINPGGAVKYGTDTQEDCLCRCTNLLPTLVDERMMESFYRPHREMDDADTNDFLKNNDDIIYSPDILIIRDASNELSFPIRKINVITCAAPELEDVVPENLNEILVKRIDKIFQVAIENKTDALVLGAWGCGDFNNPPKEVAKAFKENIDKYGKYFKEIHFPIFGDNKIQNIFEEVLLK